MRVTDSSCSVDLHPRSRRPHVARTTVNIDEVKDLTVGLILLKVSFAHRRSSVSKTTRGSASLYTFH